MSSDVNKMMTDKSIARQGRIPKLRFPEFRGAGGWKLRELSELLKQPKLRNRDLKYGPENVLSVSGEHGCINQIDFMGRSYAGATVKDYHVVKTGDVVYTKSPLKAAPYGIIKANKGADGIVSTLYAVYRPTVDASADYLDYYFSEPYNLNSYLQPLVKKGPKNDMKVNNSEVLTGTIYAPDKREQQKIADCLSSLDALIKVERERLAALREHKKGLMQALFPALGKTTPRLRFPEFRDARAWELTTVGDLAQILKGKGVSKADIVADGRQPCVRYGELYTTYGEVIDEVVSRTNVAKSELFMSRRNDVVIPSSGETKIDIATAACVLHDDIALGGDLNVVRSRQNGIFLSYFFNGPLKYTIAQVAQGNSVVHLYPTQISSLKLALPSMEEQGRIADTIFAVERVIVAQRSRLIDLKSHKSGLLQQFFPSTSEVIA